MVLVLELEKGESTGSLEFGETWRAYSAHKDEHKLALQHIQDFLTTIQLYIRMKLI